MMYGVMTNNMDYMQPPIKMTEELRELAANPAFQRMLKYAFIGSKETVREQTSKFLKETGVNEVMVASHIFNHEDRLKSYRIFSEIMKDLKHK
jgi:alkanesulfonate monooxygenase SsuD/methylene tetrahydromethanopterin reductase-like flavin-dependent oxidoreductase (luciferase family)